MDVKEIVKAYLIAYDYDGLCSDECGCKIDDLMPCENNTDRCVPGYLVECKGCTDYDWCISEKKEQPCPQEDPDD